MAIQATPQAERSTPAAKRARMAPKLAGPLSAIKAPAAARGLRDGASCLCSGVGSMGRGRLGAQENWFPAGTTLGLNGRLNEMGDVILVSDTLVP